MAEGERTTDADRDGEPRGRRTTRLRRWRLAALLLAVAVPLAGGYWWYREAPTVDDLKQQAGLKGKQELVVGIKTDMPGIGLRDPATGAYSGFDVDITRMIAADLGFQASDVRFVEIQNEDRSRMRGADGVLVDLVVATYSITDRREGMRGVTFSSPYLETEQSVITRKDHEPIREAAQLRDRRVCTLSTSTSTDAVSAAGAVMDNSNNISECVTRLLAGEVEAVTTDAVILAGFVSAHPDELAHHDIALETPELWAVNTGDNAALLALVNLSLRRSACDPADQRWEEAFERHLRPMLEHNPGEALPLDRQPEAEDVDVRTWPSTVPDC
ncbi:transporter substrate-binding domain-containing protein [Actinosynnema pretiosum]|uniref:Solute-binding protein family 3/N-terminal domain-containing protein n=1 Tax=Actinosynnema pretiosum TaxID=42197 RepID=A0A290Z7B1_9PSEU|nr:transporter substrate-binding domain-containing protein [Actinosynnema pretiosum]ATE54931.1 hypothetical protein CNX65_17930 [Actinosynnema pretiosum]